MERPAPAPPRTGEEQVPSTEPKLDYQDFRARVGRTFTMRLPDGRQLPLTLIKCVPVDSPEQPSSFTLAFEAGPDAPPQQGTYWLEADDLEQAPVFLVPTRQLAGSPPFGLEYQAVFNRASG
jgi:hypothetical protein